jgi:hypothetical protein
LGRIGHTKRWLDPGVIAGKTGVGLSQRAQSFVTDVADGPYNVIEPGKTSARYTHSDAGAEEWKALTCVFRFRAVTARIRIFCNFS